MRLLLGIVILAVACGCGDTGGKKDGGQKPGGARLDGAGSSFVFPMMQEWASAYKKAKGVEVNYQSKGSGSGISMMTKMEVDFGGTDAPMNKEQLEQAKEKGGEVIHIPLCLGAIVLAYNQDGLPADLVFTPDLIAGIYTGKVTNWKDKAVADANPGKTLPDLKIAPVSRADPSGSTFIFTEYLSKAAPKTWTKGAGLTDMFDVGSREKNTAGVAGFVKGTKGAIGYVELIYALKNGIPAGQVVNSKGKAIRADLKSVTAAAATAEVPDDLCYSLVDAPGEDAYPISGTVWAVCYAKQPSAEKAKALTDFLTWVTHDGQKLAEKLHYARLSEKLVSKIDAKLKLIASK